MTSELITYTCSASGPLPDENGVIMQGTAYRVQSYSGESRAYDIKEASGYFLNAPAIKALADYNKVEVDHMLAQINPNVPTVLSMLPLENGMTFTFAISKKVTVENSEAV
jgi:hypothetical protein